MKKLFVLVLMLTTITIFGQLPNKFVIVEDFVSIGTDFTLSGVSGTVKEQVISINTNFTLTVESRKIAVAKQKLISVGSVVNIFAGNGKSIGVIKENIFSSFGIYTKYDIYNHNNELIGTSEKHQLMSTKFTIKDTQGTIICTITRPSMNFVDKWTVIFNTDKYDKRLFVFIPCYKTKRDNED